MLNEEVYTFSHALFYLTFIETVPFSDYVRLGDLVWDFCPIVNYKTKEKKYSEATVQGHVNRNSTSCYLHSCIVFRFSLLSTSPCDFGYRDMKQEKVIK